MKRSNTILLGGVIAILLGFGVLALASFVEKLRRSPITQAQADEELNAIAAPSSATVTQHNVINKWTHGNVGNYYRTDLT